MKKIILIYSLLVILFTGVTLAQNDTIPNISPDRPTQTVGPYIVPKGSFQIETGVIYTNRNDQKDRIELWSYATTLLRYGILDNFEVRLNSSYESTNVYVKETQEDSTYNGMGPVTAGFKITLAKERGIRPELAIVASITFRHLGNIYYRPTFSYPVGILAATNTLSKRFSLGYNVGFAYSGEDADGFFIYTVYLGFQITNRLWSFAEVYGDFDNGNFPNHKLNAGLTYLIRHNLQIDISGGTGISDDVDKYFLNGGVSWRIPK
ncbi:MAG: transporter [Bacteroidales bacterium]|nr:transporter [Bacteroidales bacterium]